MKFLPPLLEPFRLQLEQASKPYVKLSRHPDAAGLANSKLGGFPYLPYLLEYPVDRGIPLLFIAQINFAELPPLNGYPSAGLLQFFISSIGAQDCTVRYLSIDRLHEAAVSEADLKLLMEMNASGRLLDNPIARPGRLQLERCSAPPDVTAFEFEQCDRWKQDAALHRAYREWTQIDRCHKLGGYGYFVQGDPRRQHWSDPSFAEFDLLLQLHSDEAFGLRWSDLQEVCFFIRPQDLHQQEFSRVRFYLCP